MRKFTAYKNRQFDRGLWSEWYPIHAFSYLEASNQLNNPAAGDPLWAEFNTKGIVGALMAAAGDEAVMLWKFPSKFDHEKAIDAYVVYGHTSTDADTPIWKVGYLAQTDGAAMSATVEGVVSVTDTCSTTANAFHVAPTANFAGGTFDKDTVYVLSVECHDLGSASANEIYLFGLLLVGTPNLSRE